MNELRDFWWQIMARFGTFWLLISAFERIGVSDDLAAVARTQHMNVEMEI